jgi:hypothetical protein
MVPFFHSPPPNSASHTRHAAAMPAMMIVRRGEPHEDDKGAGGEGLRLNSNNKETRVLERATTARVRALLGGLAVDVFFVLLFAFFLLLPLEVLRDFTSGALSFHDDNERNFLVNCDSNAGSLSGKQFGAFGQHGAKCDLFGGENFPRESLCALAQPFQASHILLVVTDGLEERDFIASPLVAAHALLRFSRAWAVNATEQETDFGNAAMLTSLLTGQTSRNVGALTTLESVDNLVAALARGSAARDAHGRSRVAFLGPEYPLLRLVAGGGAYGRQGLLEATVDTSELETAHGPTSSMAPLSQCRSGAPTDLGTEWPRVHPALFAQAGLKRSRRRHAEKVLDELTANGTRSAVIHSAVLDQWQHSGGQCMREALVARLREDLPILSEWANAYSDFVVVLVSPFGRRRREIKPGDNGFLLLHSKALFGHEPMTVRAGNGLLPNKMDVKQVASVVASVVTGVDSPLGAESFGPANWRSFRGGLHPQDRVLLVRSAMQLVRGCDLRGRNHQAVNQTRELLARLSSPGGLSLLDDRKWVNQLSLFTKKLSDVIQNHRRYDSYPNLVVIMSSVWAFAVVVAFILGVVLPLGLNDGQEFAMMFVCLFWSLIHVFLTRDGWSQLIPCGTLFQGAFVISGLALGRRSAQLAVAFGLVGAVVLLRTFITIPSVFDSAGGCLLVDVLGVALLYVRVRNVPGVVETIFMLAACDLFLLTYDMAYLWLGSVHVIGAAFVVSMLRLGRSLHASTRACLRSPWLGLILGCLVYTAGVFSTRILDRVTFWVVGISACLCLLGYEGLLRNSSAPAVMGLVCGVHALSFAVTLNSFLVPFADHWDVHVPSTSPVLNVGKTLLSIQHGTVVCVVLALGHGIERMMQGRLSRVYESASTREVAGVAMATRSARVHLSLHASWGVITLQLLHEKGLSSTGLFTFLTLVGVSGLGLTAMSMVDTLGFIRGKKSWVDGPGNAKK